jgi:hypothetical protein
MVILRRQGQTDHGHEMVSGLMALFVFLAHALGDEEKRITKVKRAQLIETSHPNRPHPLSHICECHD